MQRVWQFAPGETPAEHVRKLEAALAQSRLPVDQTVTLLAALLSLPLPADRAAPLALTPQQQRQKTLEALLALLLELAAPHPLLLIVEDLHWIDPSTLEWLGLLLDQVPTARLGLLLTARPDFQGPWSARAHLTQLTLGRLSPPQVRQMIAQVAGGKALPAEVVQQIVTKADGVPLFVEELTKTALEADWLQEREEHYALTGPLPPLAIPATLQDALMARLDRLSEGKAVAQLGAVLGRTFAAELLRAVAAPGRAGAVAWAGRAGAGRGAVPARGAAAGHLYVQACPAPGGGLPVAAQEHPAVIPPDFLTMLADAYGKGGRTADGLRVWPRHWRWSTKLGSAGGRQSYTGSRGSSCSRCPGRPRPKPASSRPLP